MALQKAIKTGGDYLDLRELAADKPVLAIFRIKEFHAPELGEHGYLLPVVADAFIVDGPRAGEVHLGERFIGAITSALRGVKNPNKNKGEMPQPPAIQVGSEIVVRVDVKNKGKANAFAVGDEPSDAEYNAAGAAYAAAGGEQLWANAAAQPAPQAQAAPVPAQGGARPPWEQAPAPAAAGAGQVW